MYVHEMSTRDIEATFADVLSGTGVREVEPGESGDAVSVGRFRGVNVSETSRVRSCCISSSTGRSCATTREQRRKSPSSLPQAIVLMGHEFFSISVLVTENPTRTGRGSYRRWWLVA